MCRMRSQPPRARAHKGTNTQRTCVCFLQFDVVKVQTAIKSRLSALRSPRRRGTAVGQCVGCTLTLC